MLDDFIKFLTDIGFYFYNKKEDLLYFKYDDYECIIYNPSDMRFQSRYSLSYYGKTLSVEKNIRNFKLDDLKLLKNIFKNIIRENRLKIILKDV